MRNRRQYFIADAMGCFPKPWVFAIERRRDDAYSRTVPGKAGNLNGCVVTHHQEFAGGVLVRNTETDHASFAAWWALGPSVCVGARPLCAAADYGSRPSLYWRYGPTFNSGKIYFPCGTPDPDDIVDGKVDLSHSIQRELKEETGFDITEFESEAGWAMVVDGPLIALIKVLRSNEVTSVLRERVLAHLASEREPELSGVCVIRDVGEFDPAMPRFISAFLASRFSKG